MFFLSSSSHGYWVNKTDGLELAKGLGVRSTRLDGKVLLLRHGFTLTWVEE